MSVSSNIRASTTTFAQLQAGGLNAILDNLVTANATIANPSTQITVAPTGGGASGGTLPAGTYYATCTHRNGIGETTAGTTRSAQFTVSATNIPRITVPALPTGASETLIYLTAANGASGTEVLYAVGVTGTTSDASTATYFDSAASAPTTNTTALSNLAPILNYARNGQFQRLYQNFLDIVQNFISGAPMPFDEVHDRLQSHAAVFKCLSTMADETVTLIDANHGTIGATTLPGTGMRKPVRTFP